MVILFYDDHTPSAFLHGGPMKQW